MNLYRVTFDTVSNVKTCSFGLFYTGDSGATKFPNGNVNTVYTVPDSQYGTVATKTQDIVWNPLGSSRTYTPNRLSCTLKDNTNQYIKEDGTIYVGYSRNYGVPYP